MNFALKQKGKWTQKKKAFSQEFLANCFSIFYLALARNCIQMLEIQFYKSSYTLLIINCTEKFNICAIYYLTDITTISSEHDKCIILCKLTSTFLFLSPLTSPSPATASSPACPRGLLCVQTETPSR